jgi:hypothetical protein
MKRRGLARLVCVGCGLLVANPSWATIVEPGSGGLSINQGKGFKPVKHRMNAKVGDSVMVGPGGAATVVYDDGCKVDVQPGAVTTIAPLSPCASGSKAEDPSWMCHPDQTHDCTLTPVTIGFWTAWLATAAFIAYRVQLHGEAGPPPPQPASP